MGKLMFKVRKMQSKDRVFDEYWVCSSCVQKVKPSYDFCPWCGTDMRKGRA